MTEKEQKEKEWAHLQRFQESYKDFPKGRIEKGKSPAPDFLVHTDAWVLGIELTDVYREKPRKGQSSLQAQESLQERILKRARKRYDSQHYPPVFVSCVFDQNHRSRKQDISTVAKQLVELVYGLVSIDAYGVTENVEGYAFNEKWNATHVPWDAPGIEYVCLYPLPGAKGSSWPISSEGDVPNLTIEQLQEILDAKESRCLGYRKECSELWLLIVVQKLLQSSIFHVPPETTQHRYRSSFDRIFLFDYLEKQYFELPIEGKESPQVRGRW